MKENVKWTEILNPGQTPVDVSNPPVYALTKTLQFMYPDEFSNYIALFGQLHIEQALHVVHGISIKGSGLQSGWGLQLTSTVSNVHVIHFSYHFVLCLRCWKMLRVKIYRKFWHMNGYTKNLRTMKLTCIGRWWWSNRLEFLYTWDPFGKEISDFTWKHKKAVEISFHIRSLQLCSLAYRSLVWFEEFRVKFSWCVPILQSGIFSFQKTNRQFSQIGLDQVHEQNNAVIKGSGGATDLLNKVDESGKFAIQNWQDFFSNLRMQWAPTYRKTLWKVKYITRILIISSRISWTMWKCYVKDLQWILF